MNKRIYVWLIIFGLLVIGLGYVRSTTEKSETADNTNSSTPSDPEEKIQHPSVNSEGTPMTAIGVVTCLSFKNPGDQQIMSCAIGLKQDDGKSFGLSSDDPVTTGSIPSGQLVKVVGTFSPTVSDYDSEGIIKVQSIEKID